MTPDHDRESDKNRGPVKGYDTSQTENNDILEQSELEIILNMTLEAEQTNIREQEERKRNEPQTTEQHLEIFTPNPLIESAYVNLLHLMQEVVNEKLHKQKNSTFVIGLTEKSGVGKSHLRKHIVNFLHETDNSWNVAVSMLDERENDTVDAIYEHIDGQNSDRFEEIVDVIYKTESRETIANVLGIEIAEETGETELKAIISGGLTLHVRERKDISGTHDESGKHSEYVADHNFLLIGARAQQLIWLNEQIQNGVDFAVVEYSSGTLFEKDGERHELRMYPNEFFYHINQKNGPFSQIDLDKIRTVYISLTQDIIVHLQMTGRRILLQKSENLGEAGEIGHSLGRIEITDTNSWIESTIGGSEHVVKLINKIERTMIDEFGHELFRTTDQELVYQLARMRPGTVFFDAISELLSQRPKIALSQDELRELNRQNEGAPKSYQNYDSDLYRVLYDTIKKCREMANYVDSDYTEAVGMLVAISCRKLYIQLFHELSAAKAKVDKVIHVRNNAESYLEGSIVDVGLMRYLTNKILQEEMDQPD